MALTKLNSQMLEIPVSVTTLSATNLTSSAFNSTTINSVDINTTNLNATNVATSNLTFPTNNTGIIYNDIALFGDLTVTGSVTALSGFNVVVTSTTTTSALSVDNQGVGPALFVRQAASTDGVANFVGGDNTEILKINNTIPPTNQPAVRILNTGINNTFVVGNSANPGSTALVVTSAGRVGIGTSTPTSTLQVSGTIIANNLQGNLTGTLVGNVTSTNSKIVTLSTTNIFNTNLTSTLITTDTLNANDINIGTLILGDTTTTSFEDTAPFQVISSSFKSVFNQIQNTATSVSASTDLALYNNTGSYVDIGIASSSYDGNKYGPTFTVTKANDGYIYNNAAGNMLVGTTTTNKDVIIFAGGSLSGTNNLQGNEVAHFKSGGNVGIGTSSPNQTLTVIGNISATNSVNTNTLNVSSINFTSGGSINNPISVNGSISLTGGLTATDVIFHKDYPVSLHNGVIPYTIVTPLLDLTSTSTTRRLQKVFDVPAGYRFIGDTTQVVIITATGSSATVPTIFGFNVSPDSTTQIIGSNDITLSYTSSTSAYPASSSLYPIVHIGVPTATTSRWSTTTTVSAAVRAQTSGGTSYDSLSGYGILSGKLYPINLIPAL